MSKLVPDDAATFFRRCLLLLSVVTMVGTALELATIRHWTNDTQLIPWFALGVLAAAIAAFVVHPSRGVIRVVRAMALLVALTALVGIYEHVRANYHAGPLDFRYTDKWATMSSFSKWWAAINKSVGPSPSLAPGVLAQSACLLFLATVRHPALVKRRSKSQVTDHEMERARPLNGWSAPGRPNTPQPVGSGDVARMTTSPPVGGGIDPTR